MAEFNEETLQLLSELARIEIREEDAPALVRDLKGILDYVDQLQEVDVSDLAPYSHAEEQGVSSLREDQVGETLSKETFLANAPDQVGGMIRVPPVMKPKT